jgi:hypothetical protein
MEKVQKPNNPKHIWTFIKIFYGRKMTLKKWITIFKWAAYVRKYSAPKMWKIIDKHTFTYFLVFCHFFF